MFAGVVRVGGSVSKRLFSGHRLLITRLLCSHVDDRWKSVLDFWFGPSGGLQIWFNAGPKVDKEIKEKFGSMVADAHSGGLQEWERDPKPSLALIILIDQFSRSIYKGTPKAMAADPRARSIATKFLEQESHDHLQCSFYERLFIYLPFEHSEDAKDQELSVSLMTKLAQDAGGTDMEATAAGFVEFAVRHKEVIDKFGRYPQRNEALGRTNTPEEEAFLKDLPDRYKW